MDKTVIFLYTTCIYLLSILKLTANKILPRVLNNRVNFPLTVSAILV